MLGEEERICTKCNLTKPVSEFGIWKSNIKWKKRYCRDCYRKRQRKANWKYRDKINTEEAELLWSMSKVCEICELEKPLHVDHVHGTDKIRGVLCVNCNTALGQFKDNKNFLLKAVKYLEK